MFLKSNKESEVRTLKMTINIEMTEQELRQTTSEVRALLDAMKEVKGLIKALKYESRRAASERQAEKDRAK